MHTECLMNLLCKGRNTHLMGIENTFESRKSNSNYGLYINPDLNEIEIRNVSEKMI